jgi:hypothetical protein
MTGPHRVEYPEWLETEDRKKTYSGQEMPGLFLGIWGLGFGSV